VKLYKTVQLQDMPGKPTRTTKTRKAKEKRIEHEREAERYLFSCITAIYTCMVYDLVCTLCGLVWVVVIVL